MKIIKPSIVILDVLDQTTILKRLELVGRTCYKSEDKITDNSCVEFIRKIIKSGHHSIIEHYDISVRVICDRGVTHEIVRHRIASYAQESTRYCISGDMGLSFKNPHQKFTVSQLYNNRINSKNNSWKRMFIKQLNEDTGYITFDKIKNIVYTGFKEVVKITTSLGYSLIVTPDHRIKTSYGYARADSLAGREIAVNGIGICTTKHAYQDKDWLKYHYIVLNKTAVQIANDLKASTSAVKKWIRLHGFANTKPKSYWNKGRKPWNKGLTESNDIRIKKQGDALRKFGYRKGEKKRQKTISIRTYHKTVKDKCVLCGGCLSLHVHHINSNRMDNCTDNLITLCPSCHGGVHNKNLSFVYFDKVVSIEKLPNTIPVYDIEMGGQYHNFVANGVVVHNCNYASGKFGNEITVIEPCFWNIDNDEKMLVWELVIKASEAAYLKLIELGATPQEARSVLPNSLKTEIIVKFNLREWRHFLTLRTSRAAHPQMREVTNMILTEFKSKLPIIFEDISNEN